jgi:hypothetical protein
MSDPLANLSSKEEVDAAIFNTIDKVCVLRFGRAKDTATMELDDIVRMDAQNRHTSQMWRRQMCSWKSLLRGYLIPNLRVWHFSEFSLPLHS